MDNPPQIQVITPNTPDQTPLHAKTIFLAGPTSVPWRADFLTLLTTHMQTAAPTTTTTTSTAGLTVYDPTQPLWDGTWAEDYAVDARFRQQVDWELDAQESASLVVVFLDQRSQAPVSLIELGLCARSGRAVVGCERGFWRRGNVQAVCARYGVPLEETLEGLVARVATVVLGGDHQG